MKPLCSSSLNFKWKNLSFWSECDLVQLTEWDDWDGYLPGESHPKTKIKWIFWWRTDGDISDLMIISCFSFSFSRLLIEKIFSMKKKFSLKKHSLMQKSIDSDLFLREMLFSDLIRNLSITFRHSSCRFSLTMDDLISSEEDRLIFLLENPRSIHFLRWLILRQTNEILLFNLIALIRRDASNDLQLIGNVSSKFFPLMKSNWRNELSNNNDQWWNSFNRIETIELILSIKCHCAEIRSLNNFRSIKNQTKRHTDSSVDTEWHTMRRERTEREREKEWDTHGEKRNRTEHQIPRERNSLHWLFSLLASISSIINEQKRREEQRDGPVG